MCLGTSKQLLGTKGQVPVGGGGGGGRGGQGWVTSQGASRTVPLPSPPPLPLRTCDQSSEEQAWRRRVFPCD